MNALARTGWSLVCAAILAAGARGGEFVSPRGYSLNYPDGWQVASAQQRQAATSVAKEHVHDDGKKSVSAAAQSMDCMIHKPSPGGFAPNINVVVVAGHMQVDSQRRPTPTSPR